MPTFTLKIQFPNFPNSLSQDDVGFEICLRGCILGMSQFCQMARKLHFQNRFRVSLKLTGHKRIEVRNPDLTEPWIECMQRNEDIYLITRKWINGILELRLLHIYEGDKAKLVNKEFIHYS